MGSSDRRDGAAVSGDDDLERFFTRLAGEAGTPALGAEEARQVLDLTRVVAHEVERRLAPLTAYALGLALDTAMPPAERARQARALVEAVRRLAREEAAGDGPGGRT